MAPPASSGQAGGDTVAAATKPADSTPTEEPAATSRGPVDGQKVYRYLLKSTALIIAPMRGPNGELGFVMGSGEVVDTTNRLVLTNWHVAGRSREVFVFFPTYKDGKMVTEQDYFFKQAEKKDALVGKVVYKDQPVDLTLIQLEKLPAGLHALPLAKARPGPGSPVFSVGHPGRSGGLWVYTEGKVRQSLHKQWKAGDREGHEIMDFEAQVLLTDSPTNSGDSGGPLVNSRGELVAVVHGNDPGSNLMSLFIDLSEVRKVLDAYAKSSGTRLALETSSPLGSETDAASVPDLMRALESKDAVARGNAARALGEMGPTGKVAVGSLLKALNDPDDVVRKLALEALTKIGTPDQGDVPSLVSTLKGANPGARAYAAGVLGKMGPQARAATRPLLDLLKDKDPAVRQSAARAVGKVGADSKDLVRTTLREALNDEDTDVRAAAAQGLAELPVTAADVPDVVALLKHADPGVREQAALALGGLGRDGKAAVKPLGQALQDQNAGVRQAALKSLGKLAPESRELMPDIQNAVKDSDRDVRRAALEALGAFGAEAKPAARAIADALNDTEVRKSALAALVKIGPPAAADAASPLVNLLSDPDKEDRLLALDALVALKPSARQLGDAIPKMIAMFEGAEKPERDRVAAAFGKLGKPAVQPLTNALGDPSKAVRVGAAEALGEIGPAARPAAGMLDTHRQADTEAEVREACSKALARMRR
jgi:HEAT repeat protein